MTPFQWRITFISFFILVIFSIATLTVSLIMINEIRADNIDYTKVTFVEVANWIYVGVLGTLVLSFLVGTPYFLRYTRNTESIIATRLQSASALRSANYSDRHH
jgi:hypothetical protein